MARHSLTGAVGERRICQKDDLAWLSVRTERYEGSSVEWWSGSLAGRHRKLIRPEA